MKVIRNGVFETNSSSSHAVALTRENSWQNIIPDEDGIIHSYLGEYGYDYDVLYTTAQKLSYLLTMISITYVLFWADNEEELNESIEGFYNDDNFLRIEKIVCERLGAKKIVIDDWYGYVDHQSYMSIPEFLEEYNVSIEDFIFGKYKMIIGNYNY